MENPIDNVLNDDAADRSRGRISPVTVAVAIIFGLFYAYALWQGLSALFEQRGEWEALGVPGDQAPVGLAIIVLLLPIVVFALAFWLGLRRNLFAKALIYVLGLAAIAALTYSFHSFELSLLIDAATGGAA